MVAGSTLLFDPPPTAALAALALTTMPALTKEVKQAIESTYVGPVALLIAQEHSKLIKQGAEAVRPLRPHPCPR